MSIQTELIEICVAILPAVLALLVAFCSSKTIAWWAFKVIGSSAMAIIGLGLLLMRLTANCSTPILACGNEDVSIVRVPGIFDYCSECASSSSSQLATILNRWTLETQAFSAALCLAISLLTTIRFVFWVRRFYRMSATY